MTKSEVQTRVDATVEPVPGEERSRKWRSAEITNLPSHFTAILSSGVFMVISRPAERRCCLVIVTNFFTMS
jgi:hypothetical protein